MHNIKQDLTFPEISIPISSKTWLTIASSSSSSPDSVRRSSSVSLTRNFKKLKNKKTQNKKKNKKQKKKNYLMLKFFD